LENKVAAIVTKAAVKIQKLIRGKVLRKKFAAWRPDLVAKRQKLLLRLQREANLAKREKERQEAENKMKGDKLERR